MPKIFYFFLSIFSVVMLLFVYQRALITDANNGQYSVRQILQAHSNNLETTTEAFKFKASYTSPHKNNTGNLPDIYLGGSSTRMKKYNKTCAKFPDLFELKFKNDNWQMQETSRGTFHIFNAYVDERNGTVVRIMAMYDVYRPSTNFYCQFWYKDSAKPTVVESGIPYWLFRATWGADIGYFIHPYIITCPLEPGSQIPVSVSLVEKPCDNPTNNLKIFNKQFDEKKDFVVCVKGLSFPFEDNSVRLAEWIELVNILGADKINFYEFNVHPNIKKMLDYYTAEGTVEVTPLSLVGDVSNQPFLQTRFLQKMMIQRRLQEVIPFNDCLYKHLNEFRFVVLLDTDEVIVPVQDAWVELVENLQETLPNRSSYVFRNVYFLDSHQHQHDWFDEFPRQFHMLQHVYRAKNYTKPGYFVKGFHDTNKVVALHNHFPFWCFGGCDAKEVDVSIGHLQHYRTDCVQGVSSCDVMKADSVLDARVWNFKDELLERLETTLKDLDISYK